MKRIAKFEKISFKQFLTDWQSEHPDDSEDRIQEIYDSIRLPRRATAGSAGYDFFAPAGFSLEPGQCTRILTDPGQDRRRLGPKDLSQERSGI